MIVLLHGVATAARAESLEEVVSEELSRAQATFATQPEKPHYIAVSVEDREETTVAARSGTLSQDDQVRRRLLDVDLRVGTPDLDSTHELRGFSAMSGDDRSTVFLPLDDDAKALSPVTEWALRQTLWRELDARYRQARERIVMVRANRQVKVEEENPAPDFEPRTPVVDHREVPALSVDRPAWEAVLVDCSRRLEADPDVHYAEVTLKGSHVVKTFVDTEGTRLVQGNNYLRVSLEVETTAVDGDDLTVFQSVDVQRPDELPTAATLDGWVQKALAEVHARRAAPRGTPYSGPVLLTGRAAGVFFHEVFGHRVEGNRQKSDSEGKTFTAHVGDVVLPRFLDVYDDPTVPRMAGEDLNGFYAYDDEGVPAQRAMLVDHGVFQGFLMSRSPIEGFEHSNGHGRRMAGLPPAARMGNTIVEAHQTVPHDKLRQMLLDEVKRQGLPYGVMVDEIEGGFTLTGRIEPNAFNVRATTAWRIYPDGRPDELVRGIDLVGTPLVAFKNAIAAGDDPQVFNGYCGAESGWVPVSAVAPSLLFRTLEFQLKEKGEERPPLLAKPATDEQPLGMTP